MRQEIERKFLVEGEYKSLAFSHSYIRQGYIGCSPDKTVRIRIRDEKGYITIKGKTNSSGISRYEWEKEIPLQEASELMLLCEDRTIEKTRYLINYDRHIWEIDEFYGANEGLTIAEIELKAEDETFEKPGFIGKEVTGDLRYYNSHLMKNPYNLWETESLSNK